MNLCLYFHEFLMVLDSVDEHEVVVDKVYYDRYKLAVPGKMTDSWGYTRRDWHVTGQMFQEDPGFDESVPPISGKGFVWPFYHMIHAPFLQHPSHAYWAGARLYGMTIKLYTAYPGASGCNVADPLDTGIQLPLNRSSLSCIYTSLGNNEGIVVPQEWPIAQSFDHIASAAAHGTLQTFVPGNQSSCGKPSIIYDVVIPREVQPDFYYNRFPLPKLWPKENVYGAVFFTLYNMGNNPAVDTPSVPYVYDCIYHIEVLSPCLIL